MTGRRLLPQPDPAITTQPGRTATSGAGRIYRLVLYGNLRTFRLPRSGLGPPRKSERYSAIVFRTSCETFLSPKVACREALGACPENLRFRDNGRGSIPPQISRCDGKPFIIEGL